MQEALESPVPQNNKEILKMRVSHSPIWEISVLVRGTASVKSFGNIFGMFRELSEGHFVTW
jgi:hypothetical protein